MNQFNEQESYEELSFSKKQLHEVADFLKEQQIYSVLNFNGKPIGVTAPNFMELKVIETVPGVRGDTAQGAANKPAKLETGITIQVPLFVVEGDILKVDTRDSSYIERIDKKK